MTLGKLKLDIAPGRELKGAAFINAAKDYIVSEVKKFIPVVVTQEGWRTREERKRLNLPKSHVNDAVAMGTSGQSLYIPNIPVYEIRPASAPSANSTCPNPKKRRVQALPPPLAEHCRDKARRPLPGQKKPASWCRWTLCFPTENSTPAS